MKRTLVLAVVTLFITPVILTGQNVGIGTDNPATKLEVADSNRAVIRLNSLDNKGTTLDFFNSGIGTMTDWRFRSYTDGNLYFQRSSSEFIGINASRTSAIFTSDGSYGFGTTTPESIFELSSDSVTTQMLVTSTQLASRPSFNLASGLVPDNSRHWRMGMENNHLVFQTGLANFQVDSLEHMRILSNGRVGIGTHQPNQHLEVSGQDRQVIRVTSTVGSVFNDAALDLVTGTIATGNDWRFINDNGFLRIMDGTNNFLTDGIENMRITPAGLVGINQSSPGARLHVTGTLGIFEESGGNHLRVGPRDRFVAIDDDDIAAQSPEGSASNLYIQRYGGNLSLCSANSGLVGVGTTSPQSKLHVSEGDDVDMGLNGYLMLGLETGLNVTLDNNEIMARNNGDTSALFLQHDAGDVMMVGYEGGQVGIGIINPTSLPDDKSYLLAVDGKVLCEEVHVELSGSWPDYVFEDDYDLTPLSQLESDIKNNGHLPGIPDANHIENEGLLVGDMQRLMMEKIEELTLYMIEADKQIRNLQRQNTALTNQIEKLANND